MTDPTIKKLNRGELTARVLSALKSGDSTILDILSHDPGLYHHQVNLCLYALLKAGRVSVVGRGERNKAVYRRVEGTDQLHVKIQTTAAAKIKGFGGKINKTVEDLVEIHDVMRKVFEELEALKKENGLLRGELRGRLLNALDKKGEER